MTTNVRRPVLFFLTGAATAYLFDPDRGRARRAHLRDRSRAKARRTAHHVQTRAIDARNRARGLIHESRHVPAPPADDAELVQKVRSEVLGLREFRDLPVSIDAYDGIVHLRGAIHERERIRTLAEAVLGVEGVKGVDNLLHDPSQPAPNKAAALASDRVRLSGAGPGS